MYLIKDYIFLGSSLQIPWYRENKIKNNLKQTISFCLNFFLIISFD